MSGVTSVTQLSDNRLQWVAQIGGVKRQWEATIVEQVPDRKVAWAATSGATNAGEVRFEDVGGGQTSVHLFLEYEPEGLVEKVGDKLNVIEKQAEGDLDRFKAFIESERYASGAWRGSIDPGTHIGTPGVEHAAASRGDDGKAGLSGKAVAAGVGLAAAAVTAAVHGKGDGDKDTSTRADSTGVIVEAEPAASAWNSTTALDDTNSGASNTAQVDTPDGPVTATEAHKH